MAPVQTLTHGRVGRACALPLVLLAFWHAAQGIEGLRPVIWRPEGRPSNDMALQAEGGSPLVGQTYDILIPTHAARANLSASLVEYLLGGTDGGTCRQLSKLYIYYNDDAQPAPPARLSAIAAQYSQQVTLVVLPSPFTLNDRFRIPEDSISSTFLTHDDDVRIPCPDLESAFEAHQRVPVSALAEHLFLAYDLI